MAMSPRLLRPRATGFNPLSVAGLGLWLDASDSSSLTMNGSGVSQIRDKSGNARHFAQATASRQPTIGSINGRATLYVSPGTAQYQLTASAFSLSAYTAMAAVVPDFSAAPAGFGSSTGILSVGSGAAGFQFLSRSSNGKWGTYTNTFVNATTTLSSLQRYVLSMQDANSNAISFFVNGAADGTGTGDSTGQGTPILFGFSGGQEFHGHICEVLVYSSVLSSAVRKSAERYLGTRWGIAVS